MWMLYASLSAVCFGARGILYLKTSSSGLDRNLTLLGVFASGAVVSLACAWITGQRWSEETLTGVAMGLCSAAANAAMFHGFAVGKPSLIAILTSLPPAVVVILAYLFWSETLTWSQLISVVVIISGVVMVRYSNDLRAGNLKGLQWGALAMVCFGLNDILSKLSTRLEADMFPTLFYMFAVGAVCFGCWSWIRADRSGTAAGTGAGAGAGTGTEAAMRAKTVGIGMLVGLTNMLGMIWIMAAFQAGITGLVSAIVAMNVVIILLYSRFFRKERFKPLEIAGIGTALAGVVLLQLL